MARSYKKPKATPKRDDRDAFTTTMLDRASRAFAFDTEQRKRAKDDMEFAFVAGKQWDDHLTRKRRNKPCYEFNRARPLIRRITGQMLKNKPQIKVRAVEDNDVDTAEVYNGLIKNIEVQSSAETAYDVTSQWSVGGGFGVLRVVAEYEGSETFDQCLKIKAVDDPVTNAWPDPAARELDRSDAKFWFITSMIGRDDYKARWPNAEVVDFEGGPGFDSYARDWWFEDEVRIAEYWYIEEEEKTIYLLSDGTTVTAEEFDPIADEAAKGAPDEMGQPTMPPLTIKQTRKVMKPCVYSCLVSGAGKLEEPTKWGGSMIPIVPQWGDIVTINGKQIWSGMTRFGRDAQMVHNFELSTLIEVVAKLPNSPMKATPAMIKGLESYYERMGSDDPPVILYNVDPAAPGGTPQREPMAAFPAALANISAIATEEMKANFGVFDASIGNRSNETSGRAILARQSEGDIVNFVYVDNQVKALKRLGDIMVDAIPHYYDAERSIRILGEDNAEKYVRINRPVRDEQTGEVKIINDMGRGKFDVTSTVGKSFDTARMELAEAAQALSQSPGPFGLLGQFLLIKSLDVPGTDEYVTAARKVLVRQGLLEPGEKDQPPPPPQPNPKDVADAKAKLAQAQKYQAEAVGQDLANAETATRLGIEAGMMGMPPPMPPGGQAASASPPAVMMNQPPMGPPPGAPMGGPFPPQ